MECEATIMSFITGKAIRDGDMEYTWGEIVLDSTALRRDDDRDILTLPKVSPGHKGMKRDFQVMDVNALSWKYLFLCST